MLTLTPLVSTTPGSPPTYNVGMAETFSWVPIENNANRPLFARAGYITNLKDLSISLSASDINIGGVELTDGVDHNIRATIVALAGNDGNALKVLTQDLESSIDDITIGDRVGNFASVDAGLSALNVKVVEEEGQLYSFNNHATNVHRGWSIDDTMRPVLSIQNRSAAVTDLMEIVEYEMGSAETNSSTIIYEWYEGELTLSGPTAIPAWTNLGDITRYRIYADTNADAGYTFTVPTSAKLRHSGIIVGRNLTDDEGPAVLYGGNSRNTLTLCIKRVDSGTKQSVWFAFTCKELQ